jgi:hypothetical protein
MADGSKCSLSVCLRVRLSPRSAPPPPSPSSAARAGECVFLVKVGSGNYCRFVHNEIASKDGMTLLKALKRDEGFDESLRGVPLDRCAVFVLGTPVGGDEPTAIEERAALKLPSTKTVGFLAGAAAQVFIRVELPAGGGREWRVQRDRVQLYRSEARCGFTARVIESDASTVWAAHPSSLPPLRRIFAGGRGDASGAGGVFVGECARARGPSGLSLRCTH